MNYIHFETIGSTNTWAKMHAGTLDPDKITRITADVQTAGRGRFNRVWLSPKGENILATFFFTLPKHSPILSHVGQILGLSCAAVLERHGFSPQIKWVNDILLEEKKVAGILAETVTLDNSMGVAVGIGININMKQEALDVIDQPATSLAALSGRAWSVQELLGELTQQFVLDLNTLKTAGFSPFHKQYDKLIAYKGKTVTCSNGSALVTGICRSVDQEGQLLIELPSGKIEKIFSGELLPMKSPN